METKEKVHCAYLNSKGNYKKLSVVLSLSNYLPQYARSTTNKFTTTFYTKLTSFEEKDIFMIVK